MFMAGSIRFVLTLGENEVLCIYLFILFIDNFPHNKIQNDYKRGQ